MTSRTNVVGVRYGLGRQVAGGAGWSLGGRVAVAALGLVSSAMLARLLPVDQMATFLLVSSLVAFAALLAGAGVSQVSIRYVAEHLARGEIGSARRSLLVMLPLGLGCAALGALVSAALSELVGTRLYPTAEVGRGSVLVGAWVLVMAAQALISDSFRGFSDIRAASLYGGPLASAVLVGGLLAVRRWSDGVTGADAILLVVVSAAVSAGLGALSLRRHVRRLDATAAPTICRLRIASVLAVSLPLLLTTSLLVALASADFWVVGASQPGADVAAYGVAARTATLVGIPLLVIHGVTPPMIVGLHARGELDRLQRLLRISATAATLPAALLAVLFILAGGPLLGLVYGVPYRAGALPLAVLSVGQLVSVITGLNGTVLAMLGHQRLMLRITVINAVVTVGALLILVPILGTTAAAVISAGGLSSLNVAMLVAVRRRTGLWTLAAHPRVLLLVRQVLR